MPGQPSLPPMKLEELMARLEDIVRELKSGETASRQSYILYDEGSRLIRQGRRLVNQAELILGSFTERNSAAWYEGYIKRRDGVRKRFGRPKRLPPARRQVAGNSFCE